MGHLCYGPAKLPSPVLSHSQVGETWFLKKGSGIGRGKLHTVGPWEGDQETAQELVRWGGGEQDRGQAGLNGRRVESDPTASARKEGGRGRRGAGEGLGGISHVGIPPGSGHLGGTLKFRLDRREQDRGGLSTWCNSPDSPLCLREEAPILRPAPGWGARPPSSHSHAVGGSLLCQGSPPRRYFIFRWSLRPEFSPGPASFRGRKPLDLVEAQSPLPEMRTEQPVQNLPLSLRPALWSSNTPSLVCHSFLLVRNLL